MPNEAAVCYSGELADTSVVGSDDALHPVLWLLVHQVEQARQDSADFYHVYGPRCTGPIVAVGHSHPYAEGIPCDQSDDDSRLLFATRRALVSIAWCADGRLQVFYQDGRRQSFRWKA